jgi:photosystem II stability/assembly factor-like uncharacterized protein
MKAKAKEHYDKIKKEKGTLKGSGYSDYMRWEWFWSRRLSDNNKLSFARKAFNDYIKAKNESGIARGLTATYNCTGTSGQWLPIGPSNFPGGNTQSQYYNHRGLGRINFVKFHPGYGNANNLTLFAGGNSGLWKSTNDGQSWSVLGTDQLDVSACSDLAITASNPNIMYAATGAETFGNHRYNGSGAVFDSPYLESKGIMKSTDGGNTWFFSGPLTPAAFNTTVSDLRIAKVLIHPLNPDVIYSLVYYHSWTGVSHWEGRVYKSTNAGATWSQIFLNTVGHLTDMKFHPTNPNIFYVAGFRLFRFTDTQSNLSALTPVDLTPNLTGWEGATPTPPPGSTNTDGLHAAYGLKIAVSIGAPNNVYIAGRGPEDGNFSNMAAGDRYKFFWISTNMGATFVQNLPVMQNCGYNCGMGASGEHVNGFCLSVTPDANTIYFGKTAMLRSINGGNTFQSLNAAGVMHPDNRDVICAPTSNTKLFVSNDAGIYMSNNSGNTWEQRSNGIQNGWIYKLDIANTPNTNSPDKTIVGLHDCSTSYTNHQSDGWNQFGSVGGDNMWVAIDPSNPNNVYSEYTYGSMFRSNDGGISTTDFEVGGGENADWSMPYVLDPNNPNSMILGKRNVWRYNLTTNNETQISNIGTLNPEDNSIRTLAVAPSNSNIIIAAYRIGAGAVSATSAWTNQIRRTNNGGLTWDDITPASPLGNHINWDITSILIHPTNPNKVWITYGTYDDNFGNGKQVFVNENINLNDASLVRSLWTNYSLGLPFMPANTIVMNNNRIQDEELYVGTDAGIFYRNKYMKQWSCYGFGLPSIPITDIKVNRHRKFMRAALYGRGVWQADLFCPFIPVYNLLGANGSPESFYAASQSITSSSVIEATEQVVIPRDVAYRAPMTNLIAGFEVKLGATFSVDNYSCTPYTANIVNQGSAVSLQRIETNNTTTQQLEADAIRITPNPFSNTVRLSVNLSQECAVNIEVFDVNGRLIHTINEKTKISEGIHDYNINTSEWSQGLYICKVTLNGQTRVEKFTKQL